MGDSLSEAIEDLYVTFAPYPLAPRIEGYPCCVSPADETRLRSRPLRELTVEDLSRYADHALLTWGTEADFKHSLPRVFELVSSKRGRLLGAESVFGRLEYAHYQQWSEREKLAVNRYAQTLWETTFV